MEARQCGYEILPHPSRDLSFSSDLAPRDFFSFPQMKTPLKGRQFDDTDEVIQEVLGETVLFNTIWWTSTMIVCIVSSIGGRNVWFWTVFMWRSLKDSEVFGI